MKRLVKVAKNIYKTESFGSYGTILNYNADRFKNTLRIEWNTCRDLFHWAIDPQNQTRFLFTHFGSNERVISFIRHAEDILKVPNDRRAKFEQTTNPAVLHINMGSFWGRGIRRSMFTILLRASQNYKGRNFWVAAKKEDYLEDTWSYFLKFMQGYTQTYNRDFLNSDGWYDYLFYYSGVDPTLSVLVKPHANRKRTQVRDPRNRSRRKALR